MNGTITVVSGPPCSGKTTYVADNRKDGDVVVDLDALVVALGSGTTWDAKVVALAARAAAIDCVLSGVGVDAWIIDSNLRSDSRDRYVQAGADFVAVDPGMDVCLARAAGRPAGTEDVIRGWYAAQDSKDYRLLREYALRLADQYPDRLEEILAAVRDAVRR